MDATKQFLWTLLVLAAGFFCMALRSLVDASPKHAEAPLAPVPALSIAYAMR